MKNMKKDYLEFRIAAGSHKCVHMYFCYSERKIQIQNQNFLKDDHGKNAVQSYEIYLQVGFQR